MRTLLRLSALALPALLAAPGAADEVRLAGGTRLEGVVLARDEKEVRLLLPGGQEVVLAAADVAEVVPAPEAPKPGQHVRYREGEKGRSALEVSLVHLFHPERKLRVDLVSAIHIGDAAYYRQIQAHLESTDVVLFEAVVPEGTTDYAAQLNAPEQEEGVGALQARIADLLGVEFQKDGIAYGRPHFVHADMTVEQFQAHLGERGRGGEASDILARLTGIDASLMKLVEPVLDLLVNMGNAMPGMRKRLKRTFARALHQTSGDMSGMLDEQLLDVIIVKRNDVVLQRVADLPPETRTASVFYGAGHMADLETRLLAQGFTRAGARWLTAWDIPP
jgi:hypothetical protein